MRKGISYFERTALLVAHTNMLSVGFSYLIGPLNNSGSLVELALLDYICLVEKLN